MSLPAPAKGNIVDLAVRAQIVRLKTYTDLSNDRIEAITGVSVRQIQRFYSKAKDRGFSKEKPLLALYLLDEPGIGGRPRKATSIQVQAVVERGEEVQNAITTSA